MGWGGATMTWTLASTPRRHHLPLLILLCSSHLISSIRRASDNESPLAAYLVTVRRPDGLLGAFEEPDALELWHTYLLGQVCNTSDPATAERFPTAESRLIYSYSHVVSGFSAWLTRQEVSDMARRPWFVEAIPDKTYKLMSVDDDRGDMGEGITIGVVDAGNGDHLSSDTAFAVAPKAHLAVYKAMAAAVDDGVDVIVSMSAGTDDTAPSYKAVARGVLVCAPAGSIGADMLKLESAAPWLLTVAASDTDRRVVTNAELGSGILKPDVSAPGVSADTLHAGDVEYTDAQIEAATSMAAAHVSGVAALVKMAHHGWSPAAIKSAIVTTADPAGPGDALAAEGYFVTGAGEVNPVTVKAVDPGLVYDLTAGDFVPYLCGMRLGDDRIREIADASCAEAREMAPKDLNYPSILVAMDDGVQQVEARRTVTNVGEPAATYRAEITGAQGVAVAVSPSTMVFSDVGHKRDFALTVTRQETTPAKAVIEGELKWVSEKHVVRSPMVVVVGETAAASSYAAYAPSIES